MPNSNVSTALPRRRRSINPMMAYDALPPVLRNWLAEAALPWSATSVRKAWTRALKESGGCQTRALRRLSDMEAACLAKDRTAQVMLAPTGTASSTVATRR